ncbi:MAG: ABC transporter ATP-binding protein [Acidobacteria bacterium]|nr:MAG: ABC transporter ATP-binding protein [Acidobacteriota bacterium]
MTATTGVVFHDVSKFYGEVLGINHVNLALPPGITSLVGPNGAGKSTLMNLLSGLIQPTRGHIEVLGVTNEDPERLFRLVGYSSQFDSFPRGMSAWQLLTSFLRLAGETTSVDRLATAALDRVGLLASARQKLASLSKGNRQRARLALALVLEPPVMVLDEPLNGLDPLARAEAIALFQSWAVAGKYVILSSHVLHEVDAISDQVVMLSNGYVVAEGAIQGVREEMPEHPLQVRVRCRRARALAAEAFQLPGVLQAELGEGAVLVTTRDPREFFLALNRWALADFDIEGVQPADEDARAVYDYLVQPGGTR